MHALMRGTSNEQRQAANRWLSEFLAQPEAWGAVEQLLSSEDGTANLFGAILLHSKIQNDFSQLAPEKYFLPLHWNASQKRPETTRSLITREFCAICGLTVLSS
jgi:hypothetical protein